jgi:hypothetical protein
LRINHQKWRWFTWLTMRNGFFLISSSWKWYCSPRKLMV